MTRLPVITAFGGFNAAGRSSFHHAYKRTIFGSLTEVEQRKNCFALASLMGLLKWRDGDYHWADGGQYDPVHDYAKLKVAVERGSLVRKIESSYFDVESVNFGKKITLAGSAETPNIITLAKRDLPEVLPEGWSIVEENGREVTLAIASAVQAHALHTSAMPVQAAGQLPSGFNPGSHYRSLHHPKGLQLSVLAASDAVNSLGICWQKVVAAVRPDEVAVYSSSVMSQLDGTGFGGMMQARGHGVRVTSKQLAMGLNTMPADFVNAYVLGSIGSTGGVTGACATFLYNLNAAAEDIKSGRRRVVMVGSAEAPILPEVIDGYSAMSALATDAEIARLPEGVLADGTIDYRRASRPFGENCGFTIAESGQYVLLMDDALALELGADIYAAVPGVFVHADGYKKSISAPGPGNYLTMARAVGLAQRLLGDKAIRSSSFVQAHGSSTPQNRVTESRIFDEVARHFGIDRWPVAAVKSYVGHSLGPASGDQMMNTLGVFAHGILPGIKTIDHVADDVLASRLGISCEDQELGVNNAQVAFLNSKGFGGNNATATVVAPATVSQWLQRRHGSEAWSAYQAKLENTRAAAAVYDESALKGDLKAIYSFGEHLIDEAALEWGEGEVKVPGFELPVKLGDDASFDDLAE
ncbi:acetoacetyl-[acyl-carrier protein] synthase [Marinagarivorans cellulosilyticus]|uniref:Acetoacetyl-[acyl-carrier protein] synthase n=1 Tax=Marinagarivorans cellulosilyticus TaxID=2721545 RepID=A0AAN2BKK1_9GAMM|nr:acetoacetyl-[acyl-carrier protein] synthase [Marinagarivorans cellulosilyticus]